MDSVWIGHKEVLDEIEDPNKIGFLSLTLLSRFIFGDKQLKPADSPKEYDK